ncbi:MAG: hypothetical protein KME26_01305 [Oscillatoria princeps RMCB-10]|nr:hypothetical protein [Oscillatoria princeps RMCB-10]
MLVLIALLLGLILSAKLENIRLVEKPTVASKCQNLSIWTIAFFKWNNPIKQELVEAKPLPPEAAQITGIPGPKYYPLRPYIETSASPGGLASTFHKGDGETMPVAIWVGETARVIPLPEPPLGLSARRDGGVWMITHRDLLFHYDSTGAVKHTLKVPGTDMVGVEGDAVWIVSSSRKQAWFVSADGDIKGPYPWEGFNSSIGSGEALCQLEGENPRRVQCLEPDGKKRYVPLSLSENPSGMLQSLTDDALLTVALGTVPLSYYSTRGVTADLVVQNVGLTAAGDPFVSVGVDDNWVEDNWADLCLSNGVVKRFSTKYDNIFWPKGYKLRLNVVAVEGEKTLVYGFDRAVWYRGERVEKSFLVWDRRYRNDVFPYAWRAHRNFLTVKSSDGTVILSTSGPTGMAIIGLRWNP